MYYFSDKEVNENFDLIFNKDIKPKILYKYISLPKNNPAICDLKFKSLKNNTLYFSSLNKLNDKKEYKNIKYQNHKQNTNIVQYYTKQELNDKLCCFTTLCESHLHWKKYATRYRGIMLHFKVENDKNLHKVLYSNKHYLIKEDLSGNTNSETIIMNTKKYHLHFLTKRTYWKDELEYRIILLNNILTNPNVNHNDCGLKLIGISVGYKCPPKYIKIIKTIAQERNLKFILQSNCNCLKS